MDYQNAVCKGMAAAEVEKRGVLQNARKCLEAARKAKVTVIHVRVAIDREHSLRTSRSKRFETFEQSGAMQLGTADTEFCEEVKPIAGEPIVSKGCVNPFIGTALTELLIGRRAGELYLAGVVTNMVVESALRHAAAPKVRVRDARLAPCRVHNHETMQKGSGIRRAAANAG